MPASFISSPAARYTSAVQSSAWAKLSAAGQTTRKSWISTRRPACAPPPKIWICGSGSSVRVGPAEIAIQRLARGGRGGVRGGHRHRQHRVAAETRLAGRAVELDQAAVERRLVGSVQAGDRAGDLAVHMADRARHVIAAECLAAVAQVERLAGAGGRARRHDGAADAAAFQQHLGFHRRTAAAVPHAAAVHEGDRGVGHAASSFVQACRTSPSASTGWASSARAVRRTRFLSGSVVMYSTGDLPSTLARNSPGSSRAARASSACGGFPGDAGDVGGGERIEAGEEAGCGGRRPEALQQQVIEAEREIERGIAPPGALGIEEHRSVRAAQDVLRADIAVHQRTLVGLGGGDEVVKRRREVGMRAGGRDQIGLQADVVEDPVGGEVGRDRGIGGGGGVDAHRACRRPGGESRIGMRRRAVASSTVCSCRAAGTAWRARPCFVETEQLRRGTGDGGVGALHPACLVAVALHRRLPVRRHAQLRQCALHADRAGGQVDAPDVRRHAAGQAFTTSIPGCCEQAHSVKGIGNFRRRDHRYATRMPVATFMATM